MIIKRFLDWARTAGATARAEAAGALVQVFLHSPLSPEERRQAEAALLWLADDTSPLVRRALAEALAGEREAPRHVVVALAHDQSDVAAALLARSPVLADADLVDCAAVGDDVAQTAIALRQRLPDTVAAALAEVAGAEAVMALCRNRSATLPAFSMMRIVERLGEDGRVREALLGRPDLPVEVRQALVTAVSKALGAFVTGCNWLSAERGRRVVEEAREAATLDLDGVEDESEPLVAHLRASGQLTAGFILRALLSLRMSLVVSAFADLSGMPARRVAAILGDARPSTFRALYRKAGMPVSLEAGFEAALAALHEVGFEAQDAPRAALSRRMIERVLTAIDHRALAENEKLFALLRRFEAEAARAEARAFVDDLVPPVRPISELFQQIEAAAA